MVLNAVLVVVVCGVWALWEQRRNAGRPPDEEFEEREAQHGRRLVVALTSLLVILAVGLVLDGLGVHAAGWLALLAVAAMVFVLYVGPWLGPRRPKRQS